MDVIVSVESLAVALYSGLVTAMLPYQLFKLDRSLVVRVFASATPTESDTEPPQFRAAKSPTESLSERITAREKLDMSFCEWLGSYLLSRLCCCCLPAVGRREGKCSKRILRFRKFEYARDCLHQEQDLIELI